MPALTILFGIALMAVGIGTYAGSPTAEVATDPDKVRSISDLLPALFGLIALTLGVGAIVKKDVRMHLMHGAVLLAALGVLIPLIRLIMYLLNMDRYDQMNLIRVILTVGLSAAYVYTAVQSFRSARASRKTGTEPPPPSKPEEPDPTQAV